MNRGFAVMKESFTADISFALATVLADDANSGIKEIINSFLAQIKEMRSYDLPFFNTQRVEKMLSDIEFDFNDMANIIVFQNQSSFDNMNVNDQKKIVGFWKKYLDNMDFIKSFKELISQFVPAALQKPSSDNLRVKSVGFYFDNIQTIITNLKLCFHWIINKKSVRLNFILDPQYKKRILEVFYKDAPASNEWTVKADFIKKRIAELALSGVLSPQEVDNALKKAANKANTGTPDASPKSEVVYEKPKSNYPRPSFKYSFREVKGFARVINKLFSKPTGSYTITAYPGTAITETYNAEINEKEAEKKYFIQPLLQISNELSAILTNTEKLMIHLQITEEVLNSKKITQKNIFTNFYLLDKKIGDFFYRFFVDIKANGIYYSINKAIAFYNMTNKISDVLKETIFNSLSNLYNAQKEFLHKSGTDPEKIAYFLDMVSVELSGLFMNINREKAKLEKRLNPS